MTRRRFSWDDLERRRVEALGPQQLPLFADVWAEAVRRGLVVPDEVPPAEPAWGGNGRSVETVDVGRAL